MKVKKRYVGHIELCFMSTIHSKEEEFYTPGSSQLLEARRTIAEYSLPRLVFAESSHFESLLMS